MTQITRWAPLESTLTPFDREFFADFNRLAAGLLGPGRGRMRSVWKPAFDVHETEDAIVLSVDLPGVDPAEVEIEVVDGVLTISGERHAKSSKTDANVQRIERFHGRFARSVYLPEGVDQAAIRASHENGVLEVTVPKPKQALPHKIAIDGVEARPTIESAPAGEAEATA